MSRKHLDLPICALLFTLFFVVDGFTAPLRSISAERVNGKTPVIDGELEELNTKMQLIED